MKVALVHDWLTGMRGGEKVLEAFCQIFPQSDIFTLVYVPGKLSKTIESHNIKTSYLQKLPGAARRYRHFLPLMPHAVSCLDLSQYDFVLSSSHCVAKGVKVRKGAVHVCYCHSPMRYIWDQYDQYFGTGRSSWWVSWAMRCARPFLQRWDVKTAQKVTTFVANSTTVARRIKNYYNLSSAVVFPPVDTEFYGASTAAVEDFYLVVSALVPYKRIDIAVEAFNQNGKKLKIVGTGPEMAKLKAMSKDNIEFLGWRTDADLRHYYQRTQALIFPGIEDFGIVPVEVMACGRPVIAFNQGGATETVKQNLSGLFFDQQTAQSLNQTIQNFEQISWDSRAICAHAQQFSYAAFYQNMDNILKQYIPK